LRHAVGALAKWPTREVAAEQDFMDLNEAGEGRDGGPVAADGDVVIEPLGFVNDAQVKSKLEPLGLTIRSAYCAWMIDASQSQVQPACIVPQIKAANTSRATPTEASVQMVH
jgi:hypothetical protein